MAIGKREQEKIDKKMHELRVKGALRFDAFEEPDILPPSAMGERRFGFNPNSHTKTVGVGMSKGASHTFASYTEGDPIKQCEKIGLMSMSQGSKSFYSTRLKALYKMRHEMAMRYARELADVDLMIENEIDNPSPLNQAIEAKNHQERTEYHK